MLKSLLTHTVCRGLAAKAALCSALHHGELTVLRAAVALSQLCHPQAYVCADHTRLLMFMMCADDWLKSALRSDTHREEVTVLQAAVALSQLGSHPISECMVGLRPRLPPGSSLPEVSDFTVRPGGGP